MRRLVVVLDSNVLIPLIIPHSRSVALVKRLESDGHRIAISPQLLDEVRTRMLGKPSLRRWLKLPDAKIREFVEELATLCDIVPGVISAQGSVPADPNDDVIVGAALESGASFIVTEDKHLLDLGHIQGIAAVTVSQMMSELDQLEAAASKNFG